MNTDFYAIGIPAVVMLVYGIVEILKLCMGDSDNVKRFYPAIAGAVGMVCNVVLFFSAPEMAAADDVVTAALWGLCSGLSATGMNQLVRKIVRRGACKAVSKEPASESKGSGSTCKTPDSYDNEDNIDCSAGYGYSAISYNKSESSESGQSYQKPEACCGHCDTCENLCCVEYCEADYSDDAQDYDMPDDDEYSDY